MARILAKPARFWKPETAGEQLRGYFIRIDEKKYREQMTRLLRVRCPDTGGDVWVPVWSCIEQAVDLLTLRDPVLVVFEGRESSSETDQTYVSASLYVLDDISEEIDFDNLDDFESEELD
jgi:hypothetical protein